MPDEGSEREGEPADCPIGQYNPRTNSAQYEARSGEPEVAARQSVEKGWHSEEREHHRIERFYWKITAALTFVAVVGAVATVVISLSSYREAQKATAETHRQAEAAERNLPRAWVYAEFRSGTPPAKSERLPSPTNGPENFLVDVPLELHNYGQAPATISGIEATMYVAARPVPWDRSPFREDGAAGDGFVAAKAQTAEYYYDGVTIASGDTFQPILGLRFIFNHLPPVPVHPAGRPKWMRVKITYGDPYGGNRSTGFLCQFLADQPKIMADPRYTYKK